MQETKRKLEVENMLKENPNAENGKQQRNICKRLLQNMKKKPRNQRKIIEKLAI